MTNSFDKNAPFWDRNTYRVERAGIVAQAIEEKIPLSEKMEALDFGCGTGLLGFSLIKKLGSMTFWDTSEGMINEVKSKAAPYGDRVIARTCDIFSQTGDVRFDLIVTLMTLHHIPDADGAVLRLTEHLKSGGFLCLSDLDEEDGSFHGHDPEIPYNGFDVKRFENLLASRGLEKISTTHPFINEREVEGEMRGYPIFLTIYRKA